METQCQCKMCGKAFTAHHLARYCEGCRQGVIDGSVPASASVRWNLRHPAQRLNTVKQARKKKSDLYSGMKKQWTGQRAYQHSYYERVTKPTRARAKRGMTDYELSVVHTIWLNKQIER